MGGESGYKVVTPGKKRQDFHAADSRLRLFGNNQIPGLSRFYPGGRGRKKPQVSGAAKKGLSFCQKKTTGVWCIRGGFKLLLGPGGLQGAERMG